MRIKHSKDSTNRRLVAYYALSTGSPFCEPDRFECLDALCIGQIRLEANHFKFACLPSDRYCVAQSGIYDEHHTASN
jgi:hypothetical protein